MDLLIPPEVQELNRGGSSVSGSESSLLHGWRIYVEAQFREDVGSLASAVFRVTLQFTRQLDGSQGESTTECTTTHLEPKRADPYGLLEVSFSLNCDSRGSPAEGYSLEMNALIQSPSSPLIRVDAFEYGPFFDDTNAKLLEKVELFLPSQNVHSYQAGVQANFERFSQDPLPPGLDFEGNYTLEVTAINENGESVDESRSVECS